MRNVLAIIIAPLIPAALLAIVPILFSSFWPFNKTIYLLIVLGSLGVGYVAFFAVGLPLVYWLKKINCLTLLNLVICGAIAGIFVMYIFGIILGLSQNSVSSLGFTDALWGIILGSSVSLTYGLISGITIRSSGTHEKASLAP